MNLFVLSGHESESFAAFLNEVILQTNKKRGIDHCSSHHNTSRDRHMNYSTAHGQTHELQYSTHGQTRELQYSTHTDKHMNYSTAHTDKHMNYRSAHTDKHMNYSTAHTRTNI